MSSAHKKNTATYQKHKTQMHRAYVHLVDEEYEQAKKILSELLFNRELGSSSHMLYYMLGITFFCLNEIIAARKYFETALEIKATHIPSLLYQGVIFILTDNRDKAIEYFLHAQSECKSQGNTKLKKHIEITMNIIKKNVSNENKLLEIFNAPYEHNILPKIGQEYRKKRTIYTLLIIFVLIISATAIFWYNFGDNLRIFVDQNNERTRILSEINESSHEENTQVPPSEQELIKLSDNRFKRLLAEIENDFVRYKDNQVWINSNIVFNSNRTKQEKNKLLFLTENLKEATYTSNLTWYSYPEVITEIWKFNNVTIKWKGTITQVEKGITRALFLINYYGESKELYNTITVSIPSNIELQNGDEVELLAKIKLDFPNQEDSTFTLEVLAFKYLY